MSLYIYIILHQLALTKPCDKGFLKLDKTSGVTKGPVDPAVRGGAILGGANSLFECGTILKTSLKY